MHVFTDGSSWVVAADMADARSAWCEHVGEEPEACEIEVWRMVSGDTPLSLAIDYDGSICASDDAAAHLSMPCAAWVIKEGRGYLGSDDE